MVESNISNRETCFIFNNEIPIKDWNNTPLSIKKAIENKEKQMVRLKSLIEEIKKEISNSKTKKLKANNEIEPDKYQCFNLKI